MVSIKYLFLFSDACFVCAVIHCGASWVCYQAIFWLSDPVPAIAMGRIRRTQHATLCYCLYISTFSKGTYTLFFASFQPTAHSVCVYVCTYAQVGCPSICPLFKLLNQLASFHETWYEHYAVWGCPGVLCFNRIHKMVDMQTCDVEAALFPLMLGSCNDVCSSAEVMFL
jgi:hypothetical protein